MFNPLLRDSSVKLSKNVVTIQKRLFSHCDSLKALVIPEGVAAIEEAAFVSCKSLESITLPSTITRIDKGGVFGFNPFQLCDSLRKIIVPKGTIAHFQKITKRFLRKSIPVFGGKLTGYFGGS